MYSWISVRDSGMLALSILKGQGGDIDVDFGGKGEGTTFILKFFK